MSIRRAHSRVDARTGRVVSIPAHRLQARQASISQRVAQQTRDRLAAHAAAIAAAGGPEQIGADRYADAVDHAGEPTGTVTAQLEAANRFDPTGRQAARVLITAANDARDDEHAAVELIAATGDAHTFDAEVEEFYASGGIRDYTPRRNVDAATAIGIAADAANVELPDGRYHRIRVTRSDGALLLFADRDVALHVPPAEDAGDAA